MSLYRNNIDSIPLLPFALAYSAGILLSTICSTPWLWVTLTVMVMGLVLSRRVMIASWTATLLVGSIGVYMSQPSASDIDNIISSGVYGGYISSIKENDHGTTAIVDLTYPAIQQGSARVKITIPDFDTEIEEGTDIVFTAKLTDQYREPDLPYETDYASIDRRDGVVARGYISTDSIISINPSSSIRGYFARLREATRDHILTSGFDSRLKEFLVAVLLGDTSMIPNEERMAYAEVGLSHIIAISGMHIAVITMILSIALWPMYRMGAGRWRPLIILMLLWWYACFTGLSPSVTRAVIMASVYIIGRLTERRSSPYNSLCFAALIILIIWPNDLFSAGFQLSFAAVLSILLLSNALNPVNPRKRVLYNAVGYVTVTVSATLGTFAISAMYFHTIPLNFLPSNLICALLFPILLGCSIVGLLLGAVGIDFHPAYLVADGIFSVINKSVAWLRAVGPQAVTDVYFSAWCLLTLCLAIACLKMWLNRKTMLWGSATIVCGLLTLLTATLLREENAAPRVYAARYGTRTDFVVDGGDGILRVVTTHSKEPIAIKHEVAARYRDFMGRQAIDSIEIIGGDATTTGPVTVNHQIVIFPTFSMAVVPSQPLQKAKVDYAVLCRGFVSTIDEVMDYYRPDTIILSRNLHPRTEERLKRECRSKDIAHISLRERPWSRAL